MLKQKNRLSKFQATPFLSIREYFTAEDSPKLGVALAELNGEYGENKNSEVDQIIFVISGTLRIELDGHPYLLEEEDALMIPRGTWYFVSGEGRFLAITNPAWFFEQYETRERQK